MSPQQPAGEQRRQQASSSWQLPSMCAGTLHDLYLHFASAFESQSAAGSPAWKAETCTTAFCSQFHADHVAMFPDKRQKGR